MRRPGYSFWLPPQDHPGLRRLLPRYRAWLTPAGRVVLFGAVAGAVMSASGTTVAAFLVPATAVGILLAAWVIAVLFRPKLELRRELPPPPSAGQTLQYRVLVRNLGTQPIRALAVLEAELPWGLYSPPDEQGGTGSTERVPPGAQARVDLRLICSQRGVYELRRLLAGSEVPSGLVRWPRSVKRSDRLVVYPRFVTQQQFELPAGRRYQPGGIAVSSDVGDSAEFLGTREYREGDRLRDVHWASFARTGRLVVREWREEYFVRIGLVLDTELPRRVPPESFEHRISLAAGIADALARRDYIIDLFAAGEELHHFQAGRALARLENVLELLACVQEAPRVDFDSVQAKVLPHAEKLSSVVLLLWDWDAARARLCKSLRESGAGVRPIVVRDGPPSQVPEEDVLVLPARGGEELLR